MSTLFITAIKMYVCAWSIYSTYNPGTQAQSTLCLKIGAILLLKSYTNEFVYSIRINIVLPWHCHN